MVRRKQRIRFDALGDDAAERLPSREPSPQQVFNDTHFDADVQQALDTLAPEFRAAVVLCDIEGLSYEEIAATLGVKLGTVRSRIHRGRSHLRKALEHRSPEARAEQRALRGAAAVAPGGEGADRVSGSGSPSPAEQHLGDRLAALVDGELGHDARERVLAHLATCSEVQGGGRRPAPAEERLRGDGAAAALREAAGPAAGAARRRPRRSRQPARERRPARQRSFGRGDFARGGGAFRYVPSDSHSGYAMAAVPPQSRARGFRVQETDRPAQRRRFAFAAAGAVSLAAIALGGALPLEAPWTARRTRDGGGTAVTPLTSARRPTAIPTGAGGDSRQESRSGAWQRPPAVPPWPRPPAP